MVDLKRQNLCIIEFEDLKGNISREVGFFLKTRLYPTTFQKNPADQTATLEQVTLSLGESEVVAYILELFEDE